METFRSNARIINRCRGTGKTTMLIHASLVTGTQIVALDKHRAAYIKKQAADLGCIIPDPIDFESLVDRRRRGYHDSNYSVLIDEVQELIGYAFERTLGCKVTTFTMSCPMYVPEPPAKPENEEPKQDMTVRELLLRMAAKAKAFGQPAKIEVDTLFDPEDMDKHLSYLEIAFPAPVQEAKQEPEAKIISWEAPNAEVQKM